VWPSWCLFASDRTRIRSLPLHPGTNKLGFDMMALFGTQCLDTVAIIADREQAISVSDEDLYDPSKPEFISPATPEEVEKMGALLLAKQIAKLEAHAARRGENAKVAGHYQSVLSSLRSRRETTASKLTSQLGRHARSAPCLVQLQEEHSRPRCRAGSDLLPALSEETPAEFEDMPPLDLDEGAPRINAVRSIPMSARSMAQQPPESLMLAML